MGNAQVQRAPGVGKELAAQLAITLDKDTEEPLQESECIINEIWESAEGTSAATKIINNVHRDKAGPLGYARSVPWDYLAEPPDLGVAVSSGSNNEAALLSRVLSMHVEEDSVNDYGGTTLVTGKPEALQFINRLLPGVADSDAWDGTPVSAHNWTIKRGEEVPAEGMPFVELARAIQGSNSGEDAEDGIQGSTAERYRRGVMSPLTTKAGSRLYSISFAAALKTATRPATASCSETNACEVATLRACYPLQLLVRFDAGRQLLCYEAFEYEPTLKAAAKQAFERPDSDLAHGPASLVTTEEMKRIEGAVKRTSRQQASLMGCMTGLAARHGGGADVLPDTTLQIPDKGLPHAERVRLLGVEAVHELGNYVKYKHSMVRRMSFPVPAITGARLVVFSENRGAPNHRGDEGGGAGGSGWCGGAGGSWKLRPHADLPIPRGRYDTSKLGKPSADNEHDPNARVAKGSEAAKDESEPLALLVLEVELVANPYSTGEEIGGGGESGGGADDATAATSPSSSSSFSSSRSSSSATAAPSSSINLSDDHAASFASAQLWPVNKRERVRVETPDWTPNQVGGRAKRHYLQGGRSEMVELANYLAHQSTHLKALLVPENRVGDSVHGGDADGKPLKEKEETEAADAVAAAEVTGGNGGGGGGRRSKRLKALASPSSGSSSFSSSSLSSGTASLSGAAAATDIHDGGNASRVTDAAPQELPEHVAEVAHQRYNSLAGEVSAILDPCNTQRISPLAHRLAVAVLAQQQQQQGQQGQQGQGQKKKKKKSRLPFADCAAVDAFLSDVCGVQEVDRVNKCLKAGLLKGFVKVPPHFLLAVPPATASAAAASAAAASASHEIDYMDDTRPLTEAEKEALKAEINKLPAEKIHRVVEIIKELNPALFDDEATEMEVDLEMLNLPSLHCLQRYVKACAPLVRRTRKKSSSSSSVPLTFLDTVLLRSSCDECCSELVCTVRDALFQTEYAGCDYEDGGRGGAVQCTETDECCGKYITGLCLGGEDFPRLDSGKGHNHCSMCPGFGECMFDYRNSHCERCGSHYFAGNSGFPCSCRGEKRNGGRLGFGGGGYGEDDSEEDEDDDYEDYLINEDRTPVADLPVVEGCWSGRLRGIEAFVEEQRAEVKQVAAEHVAWLCEEYPTEEKRGQLTDLITRMEAAYVTIPGYMGKLNDLALEEVPSIAEVFEELEDEAVCATRLTALSNEALFQFAHNLVAIRARFEVADGESDEEEVDEEAEDADSGEDLLSDVEDEEDGEHDGESTGVLD